MMSSPVLAMTTRSSPATSSIPRASFAPPVPPASTTTGAREFTESMRARTITRAAPASAPAELRLALLGERARPLGEVLGAGAQLLRGDLELERGAERWLGDAVQQPLGVGDGARRAGQQLADELLGGRVEVVGRRDAVDQADALGLGAVDDLRGHDHPLGAARADAAGQPRGPPPAGQGAAARLARADARLGGHDAQVAAQRQPHPPADAGTVDLGDR